MKISPLTLGTSASDDQFLSQEPAPAHAVQLQRQSEEEKDETAWRPTEPEDWSCGSTDRMRSIEDSHVHHLNDLTPANPRVEARARVDVRT